MERFGCELDFISRIIRDGSGTASLTERELEANQDKNFTLVPLSITKKTYIAADFFVYVVRLKNPIPEKFETKSEAI